MIYRVKLDGQDILDFGKKDLTLLAPNLVMELNSAGSFEFVMPKCHQYYDYIRPRISTLEVYEDNVMIWFGRPMSDRIDFFNQRKIYCEGPLSFFNDSIQRPEEYENITPEQFFRKIIDKHNEQVAPDRRFIVEKVTIPVNKTGRPFYRKTNYESTYDVITRMCLDASDGGGYLFFRRRYGENYVMWLKELEDESNQPIQFALNLLNYSSSFDTTDFVTCVLPLGGNDSETGQPITIANSNNAYSDLIVSEAANTYGRITKVVTFSDIYDQTLLKAEGEKYLEDTQFNALMVDVSAADLHAQNPNYDFFRVGQNIHCVSNPHLIDRNFPISKISISLDQAQKLITLGTIKRKTLTRFYKEQEMEREEESGYSEYSGGTSETGSWGSVITDPETGKQWEIILPHEPGGEVTATQMPTHITIATPPYKTEYEPGETLDFSGLSVNVWCDDLIWTNPPRYIDGRVPASELSFSTTRAPDIEEFSVMATWKYKGRSYSTTVALTTVKKDPVVPGDNPFNIPSFTFAKVDPFYWQNKEPGGSENYTQLHSGWGYAFVFKSFQQITSVLASRTPDGKKWGFGIYEDPLSVPLDHENHSVGQYTYDGKTVYFNSNILSVLYEYLNTNAPKNILSSVDNSFYAKAAWLMVYGGYE